MTGYEIKIYREFVKLCKGVGVPARSIAYQIKLYRAGVRDVRLSDDCIFLIDRLGY